MQLGHYRTSAGASPNLCLTRFDFQDRLFKCSSSTLFPNLLIAASVCAVEIQWADKTCSPSSWASYTFKWQRSPHRCMLGTVISLRWIQWENPSCYWGWGLPPSRWTFTVSYKLCLLFMCQMIPFPGICFWKLKCSVHFLFSVIHLQQCSSLRYVQLEILLLEMTCRLRYWLYLYLYFSN